MIRAIFGGILIALGIWLVSMPLPTVMSGLCLMGFGALFVLYAIADKRKWKKGWKKAICAMGISVFTVLAISITAISLSGRSEWKPARQADHAVVLGAQIWGKRPSLILQQRLDAALRFMAENPDAIVIVSGGQGSDEIVTEASVMADYLCANGASPTRIFREEEASNTRENLLNSAVIAKEQGCNAEKPVIITSEFHMARAKYIARTLDLEPVGISSHTSPVQVKANSLVREVFAFAKAWIVALYIPFRG